MKKQKTEVSEPIDFVIPWVDGSDIEWQKEKAKYAGIEYDEALNFDARYRDNGLLKYWFRGVEKFAPWVNKIHFVTCGQTPEWLNTANPKLHLVNHEDYIPQDCLPTFNTHTIEIGLHKIPGLSEKFVYFNDDIFILAPISQDLFFDGDLPRDQYTVRLLYRHNNDDNIDFLKFNNLGVINSHFFGRKRKKKVIIKMLSKQHSLKDVVRNIWSLGCKGYLGFKDPHVTLSYLKTDFEKVWQAEETLIHNTMATRFRTPYDISGWVVRYWRLASGDFSPIDYSSFASSYNLRKRNINKAIANVRKQKVKIICLNDNSRTENIDEVNERLRQAFETILPEKSSFEL